MAAAKSLSSAIFLILGTRVACRVYDPCLTRYSKGARCVTRPYWWFWLTHVALVNQDLLGAVG
ncbi:hypothetical protein D3C80_1652640 [compost metagenome]